MKMLLLHCECFVCDIISEGGVNLSWLFIWPELLTRPGPKESLYTIFCNSNPTIIEKKTPTTP
jgi:hypothetical protein